MLFNSYVFVLAFLPVVALGFFALARAGRMAGLGWVLLASLVFYAYWNPAYLPLLLASIGVNFLLGTWLHRLAAAGSARARTVLHAGVALNLAALGWFKYANFLDANVAAATGVALDLPPVILPLAISFFTFQQIAFLVDVARGDIGKPRFAEYAAFVAFFPQLIAGPIVRYQQTVPQFSRSAFLRFDDANFALGATFFVVGLFKKVVVADGMAAYATPVFDAAAAGVAPTLIEAWGGALAYTLQLYFDFSGYSDMAIGLALIFNIRLPVNFNSPYKAANIIDFWRRWHITLSHFLRDYVYIPLGGSRDGRLRTHVNIVLTMALGGLWHGAGWTFVLWGLFHGLLLVLNRAWHHLRAALGVPPAAAPGGWGLWTARALTLLAVVVGWVVFRAPTLDTAGLVLAGMAGLNGIVVSDRIAEAVPALAAAAGALGVGFDDVPLFFGAPQAAATAMLLAVVLLAPNSQQILGYAGPDDRSPRPAGVLRPAPWRWAPTGAWAAATGIGFIYVLTQMSKVSEFLYFQF